MSRPTDKVDMSRPAFTWIETTYIVPLTLPDLAEFVSYVDSIDREGRTAIKRVSTNKDETRYYIKIVSHHKPTIDLLNKKYERP